MGSISLMKLHKTINESAGCAQRTTRYLIFVFVCICLIRPAITSADDGVNQMKASTVRIVAVIKKNNSDPIPLATGSGFMVARNHVVTNAHVAENKESLVETYKRMVASEAKNVIEQIARQAQQEMSAARTAADRQAIERKALEQIEQIKAMAQAEINAVVDGGYYAIGDSSKMVEANIIWRTNHGAGKDLAVLKLEEDLNAPTVVFAAKFNTGERVKDGQRVRAVGFPSAADRNTDGDLLRLSRIQATANSGDISAFSEHPDTATDLYQISAGVGPGMSGGPLFNECGQVVGVLVEKSLTRTIVMTERGPSSERVPLGENIAWAIRADELLPKLRHLRIPYTVARKPCEEKSSPHPLSIAAIAVAITLGGVAIVIASTKPGREKAKHVVREGLESVNRYITRPPESSRPQKRLRPILRGVTGEAAGETFSLQQTALTIGRDPRVCQVILASADVSKRHCVLRYDADKREFLLEDCWSTNGTFLSAGNRQVSPDYPHRLRPGDRFYLSDQQTVFEVQLEESA